MTPAVRFGLLRARRSGAPGAAPARPDLSWPDQTSPRPCPDLARPDLARPGQTSPGPS
ncbi:hypothetical protein ACQPYA_23080 [Micromonospora sp. CA-263727]|uniref:hypothetical protein n=1 Tax=Micromonospora sp. CA-263727 TaxID=3239967 RepID=UPI003D8E8133